MKTSHVKPSRLLWYIALGLVILIAGSGAAYVAVRGLPDMRSWTRPDAEPVPGAAKMTLPVELVKGMDYTLCVPQDVREGLDIGPSLPVEPPKQGRPLVLPGSTLLDPTRLMRVKTRFNAEVVEIGQTQDVGEGASAQTVVRELRTGDSVKKGDVLAVVWSVDVGSKKSDLVDAIVQLRLDEQRYKDRLELWKAGNLPDDVLNQTRRDVITDRNTVDRAERTLRTWNVPEHEIQVVRDEAEQAYKRQGKRDKEKERLWARSELLAPRDGTIVERNVGVGEYVADNTINLFTIADVSSMLIQANPPEDQLPALLSLQRNKKLFRWTIETVGIPPVEGPIDEISYILDPNQHTAVVKGRITNPEGRPLRAAQFVSATINMPPPSNVVEIPLTALAEDGRQSFVFVQPDPGKHEYTMRRVQVVNRYDKTAYVRSELKPDEQLTPEEAKQGLMPRQPLKPGERVLTSGVLELRAALEDMMSKSGK
jgi:cobalt-zinc-cadmium efflux system membrane fusion protein